MIRRHRPSVSTAVAIATVLLLAVQGAQAVSLALPDPEYGVCLGNARNFTGLRINLRDHDVERINGVNLTLWIPGENDRACIRGLAVGLAAPVSGRLSGISLGGVGVAAHDIRGIAAGGLGVGAGADVSGIAIGGLGVGAGEDASGILIGGLGAGVGKDLRGIGVGGLGVGAGENIAGIVVGGLGIGAGRNVSGIAVGGVAVGAGKAVKGLALAGGAIGGEERIQGLAAAGAWLRTQHLKGVGVTAGYVGCADLTGLGVGSVVRVRDTQRGISFGLLNLARHLRGVQIGLLNCARNNPPGLRWLPIVNLHLR